MTFGEKLIARYTEAATKLGRRLTRPEYVSIADEVYKEATKERKGGAIHPDAERVYQLYPKKCGKEDALRAITKALAKHPVEYLLDKTNQFARAVADWPQSYRYNRDGRDLCWHPSTFFNDGHYEDEAKEWHRHGAKKAAPPPKQDLPEPAGWREAFPEFIHVDKPWHALDTFSQQHIVDSMKQRAHG